MSELLQLRNDARVDLHMHSCASDGRFSPDEVLRRAADANLDLIALTDHDLPPQLPMGRTTVRGVTVHVLHGVEVSGVHEGVELHLLVYFPERMPRDFAQFCTGLARRRADRYERAREAIGIAGLPIADQDAIDGARALTRLHLAMALVDGGHARDLREAFERYTGDGLGTVPLCQLSFVDAIRAARAAGGLTSWAHPAWEHARAWTGAFAQAGLQGIEVYRPRLGDKSRKRLSRLARQHGLFATGGSDWHGWRGELGEFALDRQQAGSFTDALLAA